MYCDWPVFGRCCFCLPLRRGILTFGYINFVLCVLKIGINSYALHKEMGYPVTFGAKTVILPLEVCILLDCLDIVFSGLLIYGIHMKLVAYIKAFYYYAIVTTVADVVMIVMDIADTQYFEIIIQTLIFASIGLFIQLYLINLVSSLLKKLQVDGPHTFENQLNQIVTGELKIEPNGIYSNTTVQPINE